jgi:hypothetical protein
MREKGREEIIQRNEMMRKGERMPKRHEKEMKERQTEIPMKQMRGEKTRTCKSPYS